MRRLYMRRPGRAPVSIERGVKDKIPRRVTDERRKSRGRKPARRIKGDLLARRVIRIKKEMKRARMSGGTRRERMESERKEANLSSAGAR